MKVSLTIVLASLALGMVGCSSSTEKAPGYSKKDFEKSAPPPEYKGPGQPGGPSSGPGAAATPPPEVMGGQ